MQRRRIAVTGGRDYRDEGAVRKALSSIHLSALDTLVHGGCRGTDLLCERVARCEFKSRTEAHPADWKRHGRAAGPIRNREMLKSGIDMLLAFPGGRGTRNCVETARRMGIPVKTIGEEAFVELPDITGAPLPYGTMNPAIRGYQDRQQQ